MRFNNPTKKDPAPQYLVDQVLPLGYCTAVIGAHESGKTSLAAAIAIAVASGKPFARRTTTQGGVLWLAAGASPFCNTPNIESLPIYETTTRPPIDSDEGIEALLPWITRTSARLLVVDPLDAHARLAAWNARESLARIKALCYRTGVTALLLHTPRRNSDPVNELTHYAAAVDQAIHLTTNESTDRVSGVGYRSLTLRSTGRGQDVNFQLRLTQTARFQFDYASHPRPSETPTRLSLDEQVLFAISRSPAALSARDVSDQLQRNPNSIRNALARLLSTGRVYTAHHARGARHYRAQK